LFDTAERSKLDTVAKGEVAEKTRRHEERLQRARWWEWLRYHEGQIRRHTATLEALVREHSLEAERYAALLGMSEARPSANGHKRGAA
jgi:hypothetical protein